MQDPALRIRFKVSRDANPAAWQGAGDHYARERVSAWKLLAAARCLLMVPERYQQGLFASAQSAAGDENDGGPATEWQPCYRI